MDGAAMVESPEGRSHSVDGGSDCFRADSSAVCWIVCGAEVASTVCGGEGAQDSVLDPRLEVGEGGVSGKFDVTEEEQIVSPVRSLLLNGGDGDGICLGCLSGQVSSREHRAGGSGQMVKPGGTWSGHDERSNWVRESGFKSVSRERESATSF